MKLYYAPGACSLAPHIALREAGLAFDLEQVDLGAKKAKGGADYLTINAKGVVPALRLDDGEVLTEGGAILQYIADTSPARGLAPEAGTRERYRLMEWINYIATELHKGFAPLFKPNTPDAYKTLVKANLARQFAYLDGKLAGRSALTDAPFTIADAYLFTILNWSNVLQIDLAPYPNLKAFMARVAARPKVKEALEAEGLLKAAASAA
jgi:glutathione S-transferase